MKKVIDRDKLIHITLLILLISIVELIIEKIEIPGWPMFVCMVLFIHGHSMVSNIKAILVGSVVGIASSILLHNLLSMGDLPIDAFYVKLLFICVFVAAIGFGNEFLPSFLNNYAFLFFIIASLGKAYEMPLVVFIVDIFGGMALILGVYLIKQFPIREVKTCQKR